ncbi:MFS transporter [Rhodococcus sp. IEGM 1379]|uniref:MFS transporter n=1 Tax=Rhodococcus sp. IEGM 1379 TaxID=3047086 RepID=UPI0024B68358|nr:MFS transporter [Rhodococcus sp. IEGM 1379]MDI9919076.1 MFS transporter [Rhodococcus sp. IEGM 1379]
MSHDDREDVGFAGRREWAALSVLVLAVVMLAVDGTVLSLAVPALSADLAPTSNQLLWIGDIYSLALAGLLVTMGTLADRVGRKRLLLIGAAGFGLASLLAAFAPTAGWLIAARFLLGVAGATLMPSTLSIIRNMFENARQRTTAIAIWAAAASGGAAIGPLVGGALLEHFWWGSVFIINVPVIIILIVFGYILIPESRDPDPGKFDLFSAALSMVAIVALVYAVKAAVSGGNLWVPVGTLVVGVAAGWVFIRRQQYSSSPLIDVSLFRHPAFAGAVTATFVSVLAFSGLLFFFSQYLQLVRGNGPLQAGIRELPVTLASVAVVGIAGSLVLRFGRGYVIGGGLALAAIGMGGIAMASDAAQYFWLAIALVLVGLGVGLAFTLTTDAVMTAVPPDKAGSASAVSETAYELGVALGIALLGSLLATLYRAGLNTDSIPPAVSDKVTDSLASAVNVLPPESELLHEAKVAFVHAMQWTSVTSAVLLAVAAVIAWRVIPSPK